MLFDDQLELDILAEAYKKCRLVEAEATDLFSNSDITEFSKMFGLDFTDENIPEDLYQALSDKPENFIKRVKKLSNPSKQLLCDIWIGCQEIALAKFLKSKGISLPSNKIHTSNDIYEFTQDSSGKIDFKITLTPEIIDSLDGRKKAKADESITEDDDDEEQEEYLAELETIIPKLAEYLKTKLKCKHSEVEVYGDPLVKNDTAPLGTAVLIPANEVKSVIKQINSDANKDGIFNELWPAIDNEWFKLIILTDESIFDEFFMDTDIKSFKSKVGGDIALLLLTDVGMEYEDDESYFNSTSDESITEARYSVRDKKTGRFKKQSSLAKGIGKSAKGTGKAVSKLALKGAGKLAKGAGKLAGKAALGAGKLAGKAAIAGGKAAAKSIKKGIAKLGPEYSMSSTAKKELFKALNLAKTIPADYTNAQKAEYTKNKALFLSYLSKVILSSTIKPDGLISGGALNGKVKIYKRNGIPTIEGSCVLK